MPITGVTNPFAQNEAVTARDAIDSLASKAAAGAELFASGFYQLTVSVSASFPIFVAPFALQVKQASIVLWGNADIAVDDVNYWRFAVRRTTSVTVVSEIASKSTQLTGGQAIAQKTDWNFDAVTFSPTFSLIAKGDTVDLAMFKTGAPANLVSTFITVRYEPL